MPLLCSNKTKMFLKLKLEMYLKVCAEYLHAIKEKKKTPVKPTKSLGSNPNLYKFKLYRES